MGRLINGRYRPVDLVARGGMGKVYRAEQAPLGRLVALKVLDPTYTGDRDPEFQKRFFLEASVSSKLTHPNTVTIFDYGRTDDDIYYIAMELLEGKTLHRALRENGPMPPDRVVHIASQICRSLREAHALGVIHRDLKPANVYLLEHADEVDFVKVLDFGLVKHVSGGEELTQTGLFMGSPKYMSPEQIRGEPIDTRVDIYALGVIMFELLTGRPPFEGPKSVNILMAHIQQPVPAFAEVNPAVEIPQRLQQLVLRCMEKNPDARFRSMDEVLTALKRCVGRSPLASGEYGVARHVAGGAGSSTSLRIPRDFAATSSGFAPLPPGAMDAMPAVRNSSLTSVLTLVLASLAAIGVGAFVFVGVRRAEEPATVIAAPEATVRPSPPSDTSAVATSPRVFVSLRSTPSGATVAVDGREYGPTPVQFEWIGEDAREGREVTFRFQRRGYRDLTVTRTLRGERLDVEAPPLDPVLP